MKPTIRIAVAILLQRLRQIERFGNAKGTLPCLKHVLIEPGMACVRLSCTDLDVWGTVEIPCSVSSQAQATLVPVKALRELLAKLPKKSEVELSAVEPEGEAPEGETKVACNLLVETETATFTLYGLPTTEFPERENIGADEDDPGLTVPLAMFASWAEAHAGFASTEDSRPILNGVLFECREEGTGMGETGNFVYIVATNGHRMLIDCVAGDDDGPTFEAIVPRKVFDVAHHYHKSLECETVSLRIGATYATFDAAPFTVHTRLIEGPYPNWRMVVPHTDDYNCEVVVERAALIQALESVRMVKSRRGPGYDRSRWTVNGSLKLCVEDFDRGKAEAEVAAETEQDGVFEIAFNAGYAIQSLRAFETDRIGFHFTTPQRATIVNAPEDTDRRVLLMPLRPE